MPPSWSYLASAAWLAFFLSCPALAEPPTSEGGGRPRKPAGRTDLYGDPLPQGALARFGTIYLRSDFEKAAFRDDGREFYTWKQSGLLRCHDAATGKVLRAFLLPAPAHSGVQFSAGGRFLTLGVDRGVGDPAAKALTVWETATGKLRRRIEPPAGDSFFPWDASLYDGRTLVTGELTSGVVRLWDLDSGTSRVLRTAAKGVVRFAPSPDLKRLFVQTHDSLQCWDVADGGQRWQSPGGGQDLVVAPAGGALLVCEMVVGGTRLQLLDPASGKPHPRLRLPRQLAGWPTWGADGRTLLIPQWNAKVVQIWDLEAGKERRRLPWDFGCVAMSPDGKSLLGDYRGLQRWDLRTGKPLYPSAADRGHAQEVEDLACSPAGTMLVSADRDGSVRFWDLRTGRPIRTVGDLGCVRLAFTPDGSRLIVGTRGDMLLLCDPTSGKLLNRLQLERLSDDFAGPGHLCLCDGDRLILSRHLAAVSVRVWPDGPGGVTAAWDLRTGKRLWRRTVEGAGALLGLSPDGREGVAWDLSLRQLESGRLVGPLGERDGRSQAKNHGTEFSQDGSLIATHAYRLAGRKGSSDGWKDSGIEVWERATRRLVRRFPVTGWLLSFAFSPEGRLLAALDGDEVWVWDVARGRELLHLRASGNASYWRGSRLAFAPAGRGLAMAAEDGSILLWEVPAPRTLPDLGESQVRRAWQDLGAADPARAFAAVADLADRPGQGVALVKERLRAVAPPSAEEVRRLVAALDDEAFAAREAAERQLAALGPGTWPVLREALSRRPSAEARRRLERLVDEQRTPSEDLLRGLRAVRVLELAGTGQAREVLRILGSGDADATVTQEAKASLRRLAKRSPADR
jgi:WD40 repeat protein